MAILLVEDDEGCQEALAELLCDEGYRVAVVGDGHEAMLYLQTHALPELIILDLMMPEMDGQEFRERQLQDPIWSQVPVIIVSARPDTRRIAMRLGVDDSFTKPMSFQELLHVIQNRARTVPSGQVLSPLDIGDSPPAR
jgi:two-component system, chemotaxis family, chemotaxis protein CheY